MQGVAQVPFFMEGCVHAVMRQGLLVQNVSTNRECLCFPAC